MEPILLSRSGYGSSFNKLYIHDDEIEKRPSNSYGKRKLELEKKVYVEFFHSAPEFPLAKGYRSTDTSLFVHYYKEYLPLWQTYKSATVTERDSLLERIQHHLGNLHRKTSVNVSYDEYSILLRSEVVEKVRARYSEIRNVLEEYPFDSVNGMPCLSFDECMTKIESHLEVYLKTKENYTLSYIHGDPQFNNILVQKDTVDVVFIDPRGYFGTKELYGISEYDTAKILFALSGYDIFDSTDSFELQYESRNLDIPDFCLEDRFVSFYPEIHFILCSIWLANAHCFLQNPVKAIISHAFARYITTLLLNSHL
jgi:hypothetical protein